MEKWFNKVAVVTGASVGIGKDIALTLVGHGLKVVGCGRNFERLEEIKNDIPKNAPGQFFPFKCDVSKEEDVLSLFKFVKDKFNELSILINNAAFGLDSTILTGKTEFWRAQLDTNVLGLCMCTREAYSLIRDTEISGKSGSDVPGHIININSIGGHIVAGIPIAHFYVATKHAVKAISEAIRHELREAKSAIKISQISPSYVETEFFERAFGKDFADDVREKYPRPLITSDVSKAVVFVLSTEINNAIHEMIIRPNPDPL